jgi:hypothetical protein
MMKCLRRREDANEVILVDDVCTPEEEALCETFRKTYKVIHVTETTGLYGSEHTEVTLAHHQSDYTDEQLLCILCDGIPVGCVTQGRSFYVNGKRNYRQVSSSGPQGPLIWDSDEWELVNR